MRTNKNSIFVGVAVLALTVGLNVRHALNDYGVKSNKLHLEVLAVSGSSSGYSLGFPGTNWEMFTIDCTYSQTLSIGFYSQTTQWTERKNVCGKGSGSCWALAGC